MNYIYYPGCSLEGTAHEYDLSTRALMQAVGATLTELADWTCCGASAAEPLSAMLALALPARNIALAESLDVPADILAPCSACYLNLKKVEEKARVDNDLLVKINTILDTEGLHLQGRLRTRHLLDVIVNDVGADKLAELTRRPLNDLVIAPYYGCQCLRPYSVFDDPEKPRTMEPLLHAVGAAVHDWDMGARCCGASHMNTKMKIGLQLSSAILDAAQGADAIVTVCPMCQMNLEAHQAKIAHLLGRDIALTILYLPQLLGLALGLSENELGLPLNLSITDAFRSKLKKIPETAVSA